MLYGCQTCVAHYKQTFTCVHVCDMTNVNKSYLQFWQQKNVYNCATSAMQFMVRKINSSHIYNKSYINTCTCLKPYLFKKNKNKNKDVHSSCTVASKPLQLTVLLGTVHKLQLHDEWCYMITTCKHMILTYTAPILILETAKQILACQHKIIYIEQFLLSHILATALILVFPKQNF